ncbi:MAG: alpha/beta hydrolase, partial [Nitrososphaerales archaeon]
MSIRRWLLLGFAAILIALSWFMISAPRRGLVIRQISAGNVPMLYVAPAGVTAPVPGVVIAHGFAGSKQLMLGYAYTLAHAGYATILFDFNGHGANGAALDRDALQANIAAATSTLIAQPEVDRSRLALLGHSMGSGAVMTAGINEAGRYSAVVAISPTGAAVRPDAPRNLLLQAGSLEGRFAANAGELLAAAGGRGDDFAGGRARNLVIVPFAEHISILFRRESHAAALDWLGRAFGAARSTSYVDRRILWYGLHLAGWLLVLVACAPVLRSHRPVEKPAHVGRRWLGLLLGTLAATAVAGLLGRFTPLSTLLGIQVGAAVAVWFLIAGVVWLWFNRQVHLPTPRDIGLGVIFLGLLVLAFGVMGQVVWVQWWPIPARAWRWPILALACLPWFLAAGYSQWGARAGGRVSWWLGQTVALVAGLYLTLMLAPSLGFLVLLMPLLPLILLVLAIGATSFDRPWAYAIGSAFF